MFDPDEITIKETDDGETYLSLKIVKLNITTCNILQMKAITKSFAYKICYSF